MMTPIQGVKETKSSSINPKVMNQFKYISSFFFLLLFTSVQAQENSPLYRSTDNGESWHAWSEGLAGIERIDRILADGQMIYLLSEHKGILRSSDGGQKWIEPGFSLFLPRKIDVLHKFGSLLFAGTYQEGVYVSADQGNSWVSANKGLTDLTIRAFHSQKGVIWAGTNDGLFRWDTEKQLWEQQLKELQVNAIVEQEGKLFVATHKGIQSSTDLGKSWMIEMDQGTVKQLYQYQGQIYACAMSKKVWRYRPNTQQWADVTQEFPTAGYSTSILYMDDQVTYAAQSEQLYRKAKEHTQWEKVGNGLPTPFTYRDLKMVQPGVFLLACAKKH